MEYLGQGLQIAATGILVVFAVLCVMALAMVIMSKLLSPQEREEALEAPAGPGSSFETRDGEIAAVISAVYAVVGNKIKGMKITKRGD